MRWTCEDARLRGCVRCVTFPTGGGVARERLCMSFADAIEFFDPFQRYPVAI